MLTITISGSGIDYCYREGAKKTLRGFAGFDIGRTDGFVAAWEKATEEGDFSGFDGTVRIIVDTANVVYAPAEVVARFGAEPVLASSAIEVSEGDIPLVSVDIDGIVAIWPVNQGLAEMVKNTFERCQMLECISPLHTNIAYVNNRPKSKRPLAVALFTRNNLYYIRLSKDGILERSAAYPMECIADGIYAIKTIEDSEPVSKLHYVFRGELCEEDKKLLKRTFKRSKCE